RSGVNQASIYDYIANKNDILRRLMNQVWFRLDVPSLPEILEDSALSLEEVFIRYFRETWTTKRNGTLLVYRSVPYMLDEDRKAMHAREIANMKDVADELRRRSGREIDDAQLEILANLLVFLAAFGPMRDWLNKDVQQDTIIRTVATGVAAMVRALIGEAEAAPGAVPPL
ncbi:MAG: TetR/AcrR family transcriptional regulator, partial [Pseudodonghicola sp.]